MNERNLNILETQFKQRAYDGKWERIVRIIDNENRYIYNSESGQVVLVPTKWVTVGVYDYLCDRLELKDGSVY